MKRKHALRFGLTQSVIGGAVCVLLLFGALVMTIGYARFTTVLRRQYQMQAHNTAQVASTLVDADSLSADTDTNGDDASYTATRERMVKLADSQNGTSIYVLLADSDDYSRMTYAYDTAGQQGEPFVVPQRETDGEDERTLYRDIYENGRQIGYLTAERSENADNPYITAMVPLKGSDGSVKGILCVQCEMDALDTARRQYMRYVLFATIGMTALTVLAAAVFMRRRLIRPIQAVTKEAERFARETSRTPAPFTEDFSRIRELNTLASSIDTMENDTLQNIDRLTAATAERERIGTELHVARKIQTGLLPAQMPAHPLFDIAAFMQPAKEIGGDFYDFFLRDDDHLVLVMADVSGKGIPAALFMTAAKVSIHVCAMNGGTPAQILAMANERIYENNAEDMFVTVWLGILELSSGKLLYANAGHEDPVFCRGGRFQAEKERHGFVLGAMPHTKYRDSQTVLQKDDKLFLYTDGVTDAMNGQEQMFGMSALEQTLNDCRDPAAHALLQAVRSGIKNFTADAPQFDDITMLCLAYNGKGGIDHAHSCNN